MPVHRHTKDVEAFVPIVYASSIEEFGLDAHTDMSRSNKCHTMTLDLFRHLSSGWPDVRRELHQSRSGRWHYVIAHSAISKPPSPVDVITDLSPWYFHGGEQLTGYLHAPRQEVMEILAAAGAPEEHIALRALHTITLPHTAELLTAYTHPPLPFEQ